MSSRSSNAAHWPDCNKKVLIDALVYHSDGRFSNLVNDKKKWDAVVNDFNLKTSKSLILLSALVSILVCLI